MLMSNPVIKFEIFRKIFALPEFFVIIFPSQFFVKQKIAVLIKICVSA